jgi:prolipoprotein diacylglyceryltransferase
MPFFVIPFPQIDPVLVEFGPFAIRWYALAYIAGLLLGGAWPSHLFQEIIFGAHVNIPIDW